MKILITGAGGLLGPYLSVAFEDAHHQVVVTCKHGCDLTNRASVKALLTGCNPDVVVHAAAETNVEYCEAEPVKAYLANRDTTYHIVEQLEPKAKLVYISTDMVYPDLRGPHREGDVAPVNVYGRSKLAGEKAAAVNARHFICRTNFFGPSKTPGRLSFSDWVIQSLTDGSTPIFFNDQYWTPIHMKTLCTVILEAVERDLIGTYNVGATTGMNKAKFAMLVAAQKGLMKFFERATIGPAYWTTPRPHNLGMDPSKIEEALNRSMPTLEEEIEKL